jgi:hypothetical protein
MLPFTRELIVSMRKTAVAARGLWLLLLIVALAIPCSVQAQYLYGTLTGSVTDQQGAVTVGAKVTVKEVHTNVTKTVTTDGAGNYRISDLQPGTYDVTVEAPGFKTLVQKGAQVETNSVRRVNAQLQVSPVTEVVEVAFKAPALQTDRADVHVTQTAKQVNDLPLFGSTGRNYQSLMQTVPGAVIDRVGNQVGEGEMNSESANPQRSISFNVNGVNRLFNQTKIDGSSVVYVWLPTNTAYVPSAEAIEEVSISTNSYNADQGMAGGAAVNVVVKSGTNQYHATAWGYDTNSHFAARNYFQTTPSNPKLIVAQFGGNLGGPIVKDKLFFFANIERSTKRNSSPVTARSLAPNDLRPNMSADGSVHFPDAAHGGATIYDPASSADPSLRQPFPNNTIPANRIDQAALYLSKQLPATQIAGYVNNYTANGVAKLNRTNMDFKVNYAASSKLTLFARYSHSPHEILDPYALGNGAGGGSLNGGQIGLASGHTEVLGTGLTYTFSPTLMLDANFGFTHQVLGAEAPDMGINIGSDPAKLGIPGTNGSDRLQGGIPSFQITGWNNLGNDNTGNPFSFNDYQYVLSVNLQKTAGKHLFRIGGEWQKQEMNHFQPQGGTFQTARGTFGFNGLATELQGGTAPSDARFNSWAQFLLGLPSTAGKAVQQLNPNSFIFPGYNAYVQDTWQVSRSFTLTLGVRWELFAFPYRPDGLGVSRFDTSDGYVYNGGRGDTPQNTFASSGSGRLLPRIGFAYRLNEKTVLRAGYGQSSDPQGFNEFRNAYPVNNNWQMPAIQFAGKDNSYIPVTTLRQGLINAPVADITAAKVKLPANVDTIAFPKTPEREPIHSWNVTLQRELASYLTIQAAYVGTYFNTMGYINYNTGAPGTGNAGRALNLAGLNINGNENIYRPFAWGHYNGLQMSLQGRAASAQYGVSYTYSKTINYFDNQGGPRVPYLPSKEINKGPAGYDHRHNLSVYGAWDLPTPKGGIGKALLGGWQINGLLSAMTGLPFWVSQSSAGNLLAAGSSQTPDQVGTVAIYPDNLKGTPPKGADVSTYRFFDTTTAAFVPVTTARFGNAPRNGVVGPNYWNLDLGLFRTIGLSGRAKLQLRAEALNALNHPNFANPGSDISTSGSFGYITSTTGVGSRSIRFGVRLSF